MSDVAELDRFRVRIARSASGLLAQFNDVGVLVSADVHVASRLASLAGETDDTVILATALAVRAPRLGHVFVDLGSIAQTATVDAEEPVDLSTLPWPDPVDWLTRVGTSPLTGDDRPLRLDGTALYLDRYWREERQVASDLLALANRAEIDLELLTAGIERLFPGSKSDDDDQRVAAAAAVLFRLAVVAGGPGTGKTTTVARIVALLDEQATAAGLAPPLVALAAPTGKAAARLQQAVHEESARIDIGDPVRDRILGLSASTLHRLLGWKPGSHSRFRHDRANRLPYDVIVVDETSMVSLSLMARLVESVRDDARLILVGDPGQLTSIEAGAVLGDIVGPSATTLQMTAAARAEVSAASGVAVAGEEPAAGVTIGDGVVVLRHIHRFGANIRRLAEAIRLGDSDEAVDALIDADEVEWIDADAADLTSDQFKPIRTAAIDAAGGVVQAARDGNARDALDRLGSFRVLCAHRRGPYGVSVWMPRIESWLSTAIPDFAGEGAWYLGRPLLVTENDHTIRIYNGDTGVVVASPTGGHPVVAFDRQGEVVTFTPSRLNAIETVYAMTIHKSQGSQFETAVVVLPEEASPILTRELLYTAATRAQKRLIIAGSEETIRAAVARPVARASGLGRRLWDS